MEGIPTFCKEEIEIKTSNEVSSCFREKNEKQDTR
jgi:hypothetical protein